MNKELILSKVLDPSIGYTSAEKLYRKMNKKVSIKEIQEVLDNLQTYQVNTTQKPKKFNSIAASYIGDVIQADLMDVSYYSTENNGVKFLLTFIDVYSRYVMLVPIKLKNMKTVVRAMTSLIEKFPVEIKNVTTDDGPEFHNKEMEKLFKSHKIRHWITPAGTPNKLSIIERFHRTLRTKMNLYFSAKRTNKYIDVIEELISNYNNTYHSTIKETPFNVFNKKCKNNQILNIISYDFKKGDIVRKVMKKGVFDKGEKKFSDSLYVIDDINNNSYSLRNKNSKKKLQRRYLGYELKKINSIDNVDDKFDENLKRVNKKKRLQKKEKAFNDKNTHKVDDYGNVKITRKHLIPKDNKRVRVSINRLNL